MIEKYYIGPVEQEILDVTDDTEPVATEDVVEALAGTSPQVVRNALAALAMKGRLFRVKRGVYLRTDPTGEPVIEDPGRVGLGLFRGYLAFATALRHWRLVEYEPFTVHVATRSRSAERELGAYVFKAVSMGRRAQGALFDGGVYVSTLEKTLFDCAYKPSHSGGHVAVARAMSEAEPDWDVLLDWFAHLGTPSLRNRAGYLFERAGNAPGGFLEALHQETRTPVWLDPSGPRRGELRSPWRVLDNVGGWGTDG